MQEHPTPPSPPVAPRALPENVLPRRSRELALPILELMTRHDPETLSAIGFPGSEDLVTQLPVDGPAAKIAEYAAARAALRRELTAESHPTLRIEIEALLTVLECEIEVLQIEDALLLPYFNLDQLCFQGILALEPHRAHGAQRAILARLRRYAGLAEGYAPLAEQAEARIRRRLGEAGLLAPCRRIVEADLAGGKRLLAGLERLLAEGSIRGYEASFRRLQEQLAGYSRFVRQEVLPRCRDAFALPPELYAARLRAQGITWSREELASRGRFAFRELRSQLEREARSLARERGLPFNGIPDLVRQLHSERLPVRQMLRHYRGRLGELEELVAREDIVSLSRLRLTLRQGTEGEAEICPFVHLRLPRVYGRRKEMGELVLPRFPAPGHGPGGREELSPVVSWTLLAHEALPGHALQNGRLLEQGAWLERSLVSWNPASREGWAVYAESEVGPYLPVESRFILSLNQLRRAAAAFLDPGLQQGIYSPEQARELLRAQVGLSAEAADRHVWRATLWQPGQAATYFHGYAEMAALRAEVECRLGADFQRRQFHDTVLDQGILPLPLLRRRVQGDIGWGARLAA